ncbi:MAG: M2 family metallopeptidase [Arenimonas sp.]
MNLKRALIALSISAAVLSLGACKTQTNPSNAGADNANVTADNANETADQFVARINAEMRNDYIEASAAQWLSETNITDDSQLLASKANERALSKLGQYAEEAKRFDGQKLSPETARALQLLKLGITVPPPKDPKLLAELTEVGTKLNGEYGAGKYCKDAKNPATCKDIGQIEDILANSNSSYEEQLDAWQGWHTISVPMRPQYQRFVELNNIGAKDQGFANTGELWRSGYDMKPAEFQAETDRLWGQVKPLYDQLQCYTKNKLVEKYGADKGQVNGMIPAHLTGNLWQQDWGNLWPLLQPYNNVPKLDINSALQKQRNEKYVGLVGDFVKSNSRQPTSDEGVEISRAADLAQAKAMVAEAEGFYVSLGMPKLPESFWDKSQFIKPRDREVVCHASAWPMTMDGEVRIKVCIKPDEDSYTTIYHELGHIYYYLAYQKSPALFQNGANDGFHEAIGDTIVLSMTPEYLNSKGLVDKPTVSQEATINAQMRMALAKVSFLPFGLMIDRWRWGVFDGSIKPENYNKAWWELKAKYQGVAPATPRGEEFFDAGAKYHVPGNTPYTRYFMADILQFQFYKSLCDASGFKGPLYQCSFANNPEAGKRYWNMLGKGASQPWQLTMKELTGGEKMDASAVLEYFAPLDSWLKEQNKGKECGWK